MSDASPEARLRSFLVAVDRDPTDVIRMLAARPVDPVLHASARRTALEAADAAGRSALVDESRRWIVDWLGRTLGTSSFDPTLVGLAMRYEQLRIEDRMALAETIGDAALACIVRDRVDEAVFDELVGPCAFLTDPER